MTPFPRFFVQRVEHSPPCLVGQLSTTSYKSETWVQDGWVGFLRSDTNFIEGRWREAGHGWVFVPESADALRAAGESREFEVFDGYWGERAELVLDESLDWHAVTWSGEADHDHCRICWASISIFENREHVAASPHLRVCGACYSTYIQPRSLTFITPRPAA